MTRNELVEKMGHAGWEQYCPTAPDLRGDVWKAWIAGMSAALDVALDDLLADLQAHEIDGAYATFKNSARVNPDCLRDAFQSAVGWLLASRRAALAHVKTAEERVTVDDDGNVLIDGGIVAHAINVPTACMIMNGIIRGFKEQP